LSCRSGRVALANSPAWRRITGLIPIFQERKSVKRILKKADNVIARNIADETLLVPIRGKLVDMQKLYALDATSKLIWSLIDGENSFDDILDSVVAEFDVDTERAESDLQEFVDRMRGEGIIVEIMDDGLS